MFKVIKRVLRCKENYYVKYAVNKEPLNISVIPRSNLQVLTKGLNAK